MERNKIIILIAVVAAVAVVGGYFLLNNESTTVTSYNTILLSKSAYMEVPAVPDAKSNGKADKDGIFHYVDRENGINVTSCNSNISKKSSVAKMNKMKNESESNATKIIEDGVVVYEKNGTYMIFVKNIQYNNTVMLQSFDKDLLMACWQSLKFHDPTDNFKISNKSSSSSSSSSVVVDAVEETQSVVGDVSSQSTSSDTSSSSSSSASYSETDTSYTTSGDSWSYGGYGSSSGASSSSASSSSSRGYTDYDFSED